MHPLRRNDNEYVRLMYIQIENKRARVLTNLRNIRKNLESHDSRGVRTSNISQVSRFTNFKRTNNKTSYSIDLVKRNMQDFCLLDPEVMRMEKIKAVTVTTKELQNIVERAKNEFSFEIRRKDFSSTPANKLSYSSYNSAENSARRNKSVNHSELKHKNFIENILKERENKISQRIYKEKLAIEKWKSMQNEVKRNNKIADEFERERNSERKKLLQRKEEYKRKKLLDKITEEDLRTQSFQQTRMRINKLRQEMRKNSTYTKYLAKNNIEKLTRKFNTIKRYDDIKLTYQMLMAAGLKNLITYNTKKNE